MQRKWIITVSCLTILGLFAGSCSPAAPPAQPAKPTEKPAAAATAAPAAATPKPAAPAATPKPSAEQPKYGGVLAIPALSDPISLDMQQETSFNAENVLQLAYNGVTQFNPDSPEEVIGDLAKNWELSRDGITYTFRLNESVKFHDGSPLTAEDVRFSFERMTAPPRGIAAPRRADLDAISKLEAPDKDTVKFILKYPSAPFLSVTSSGFMVVYSRAFVEKKVHMKNDVMGTGPYKFKSYSPGTSLVYVKNPDYFVKGRPYLDGVTFYFIRDAATRLSAFRTGRIKLTGPGDAGLSPTDADTVKKTMPQAITLSYPGLCRALLILNNEQQPWADVRVRRAALLAVDRPRAIDVLAHGFGELGSNMPGKWGMPREDLLKTPGWRQPKDADIADAQKLLAEAGYPNGFGVKALVRAEKAYEEVAVFAADQLAKVGIKLELEVRESAVRTTMLQQGNFSIHPEQGCLSYPDPTNVARYFAPPRAGDWGQNWQRDKDSKTWELFEKQSRAVDPKERAQVVRELDLRLNEMASRPLIYWRNGVIGMWPEVRGRGKLIGNYSFQKYQDVWLAQ
ncbi:MAG: hypothetical protein HYX92_02530 [Chloroflexi bacterium]|nr:hypothetical protein [Chloroflexota bacterium]